MNNLEIQSKRAKVCLARMKLSEKTLNKMARGTAVYYKLVNPESCNTESFDWDFKIPSVQAKQKDHLSSTKALKEQEIRKKLNKLSINKPKKMWNVGPKYQRPTTQRGPTVGGIRAISTSPKDHAQVDFINTEQLKIVMPKKMQPKRNNLHT